MATLLAAALPYLLSSGSGAAAAGGLSGMGGLANILGGGAGGLGTMAGTPMAGGMMGPTQGSGIMGALSGGGMAGMPSFTNNAWSNPDEKKAAAPAMQFAAPQQSRFTNGLGRY